MGKVDLTKYSDKSVFQLLKNNPDFRNLLSSTNDINLLTEHLNEKYILTDNQIDYIIMSL